MCWECLPSLGTFRKHWFKTINNEAQTLFQLLFQLCAPSFFFGHTVQLVGSLFSAHMHSVTSVMSNSLQPHGL